MAAQGQKLRKKNWQQYRKNMSKKTNVFKIECCGSSGQPLPVTERTRQKVCRFRNEIGSAWEVVANEVHTVELKRKMSLTKAKERATRACRCRRVSVQRYSVQYKGYNLIGVTTVEGGATRGTTALVC
jgi:hypothetical protein